MIDHTKVQAWIDGYVAAWRSAGTSGLTKLFTVDVNYRPSPWAQPLSGLEELKSFWEQERTGPNEAFTIQSEIVAIENNTAVARIEVTYEKDNPSQWRDLWIMQFSDTGLCSSFEEWPFYPSKDDGHK